MKNKINNEIIKRQSNLLSYIVKNHIKNGTPIGSLEIYDSKKFSVSAATIRNDMNFLEKKNLLRKSHVVGGRIPTTNGYKYFLNFCSQEKRIINKIKVKITKILNSRILNIDEILNKTCKIISDITNTVVIQKESNLYNEQIKKIELLNIDNNQVLIILITNNGKIFSNKFNIDSEKKRFSIIKCVKIFQDYLLNTRLGLLKDSIEILFNAVKDEFVDYELTMQRIINFILIKLQPENKIFGLQNLINTKEISDNYKKLRKVINFLENKSIFDILYKKRNLSKKDSKKNNIKVTFGKDVDSGLDDFATITGNYKTIHGNIGNIAFFGTKRLEYKKLTTILKWFIGEFEGKY